jgi:hypothetical protein
MFWNLIFYLLHPIRLIRLSDTFRGSCDLLWKTYMKLSERKVLYECGFENINLMTRDHSCWNILKMLLIFWIVVLLAYFSYFEKIKVGFCDHHALCETVPPLLTTEWLNQSLWILVCASWQLSRSQRHTSWSPSISQCVCVYSPIVASQRLGKNDTASTNTHEKIEEFLDASFSVRSVLYQRKVGD